MPPQYSFSNVVVLLSLEVAVLSAGPEVQAPSPGHLYMNNPALAETQLGRPEALRSPALALKVKWHLLRQWRVVGRIQECYKF